ncbi:MAG: GNAT family N-acetyltransferase [Candidatus Cloacimonadales bacterium]|nr:GNAT family N-acetyltransferase [Candidatus Cloacimonadales bacterium]
MIRKIKPSDKPRVLEICSQIWEGDDYLPLVFDEWVEDNGVFAGLWENDILVGFGKLTYLTPTDVWLEGLRKDEKSGAKNVGEKLSKFYLDYLRGKKIDSVRFSTYFGNAASIKLNEKMGFRKILIQSLKTKIIEKHVGEISANLSQEIEYSQLKDYIEKSQYLKASKSNIYKGWVVHQYSDKLLREYYNKKNFVVWLENDCIQGCALWSDVHYNDVFWISLLEADNERIFQELLNYFFHLNNNSGKKEIEILVPTKLLLDFCNKNGFTSWEQENDFYLYELPKIVIDQITQS